MRPPALSKGAFPGTSHDRYFLENNGIAKMSLFTYFDRIHHVPVQKGSQDCSPRMAWGTLASSSPKGWKEMWEWGMHFNERFP